jgi:hypothetical protein
MGIGRISTSQKLVRVTCNSLGYLTLKNANLPDQQRMLYSLHNIATLLL